MGGCFTLHTLQPQQSSTRLYYLTGTERDLGDTLCQTCLLKYSFLVFPQKMLFTLRTKYHPQEAEVRRGFPWSWSPSLPWPVYNSEFHKFFCLQKSMKKHF